MDADVVSESEAESLYRHVSFSESLGQMQALRRFSRKQRLDMKRVITKEHVQCLAFQRHVEWQGCISNACPSWCRKEGRAMVSAGFGVGCCRSTSMRRAKQRKVEALTLRAAPRQAFLPSPVKCGSAATRRV